MSVIYSSTDSSTDWYDVTDVLCDYTYVYLYIFDDILWTGKENRK